MIMVDSYREMSRILRKLVKNPSRRLISQKKGMKKIDFTEEGNEKVCQLKQLSSWFNFQKRNAIKDYKEGREINLEKTNVTIFLINMIQEPTTNEEKMSFQKEK
jgi:hypothetical protein